MNAKLITTAVGAFGFGALFGWAITGDAHERRLVSELDNALKIIGDKQALIMNLKDGLNFLSAQVYGEKFDALGLTSNIDPNQGTLEESLEEDTIVEFVEQMGDFVEDGDIPEDQTPEETRTNLQNIIDRYTARTADEPDQIPNFVDRVMVNEASPPFVISKGDYAFGEEGESYSKITLTYFHRERVLVDDDEDPIPPKEIDGMVGWKNLTKFGGVSEDDDVVFVRNHRMETDFEVVKEDERTLPLHLKYGMEKEEFYASKAAGIIKLRPGEE